MEKETST